MPSYWSDWARQRTRRSPRRQRWTITRAANESASSSPGLGDRTSLRFYRDMSADRLVSTIISVLRVESGKLEHERSRNTRNPRFPGRGQATAAPDGAFAVQQQGNLPARAHFKRLGRLRQATLRSARRQRSLRE